MKKSFLLLMACLLFLAGVVHAEPKRLKIGISTGYPPFYFFTESGQPTGICIDILNHVAEKMGISVRYASYPWQRMLLYGKHGNTDGVMPLFKTPEREEFLLFPQTALINEDNSFFTAASSTRSFSGNLADVVDSKIGVMDGFSYGPEFDRTEFPHKVIVKENTHLIKMVQSGRVDLGIGNSRVITYVAQKMNAAGSIRFLSPPVTVEPLYIGFSKAQIAPDFVERFNRHLQNFKATLAYREIISSYDGL